MLVVAFMFATAPTSTQESPQRLQSFFERACNVCAYFDVMCVNIDFCLLILRCILYLMLLLAELRFLKLLEIPIWRGPSSK
jgi:hypothetical protein